jgi:DNA polymerase-3 subunit delta
LVGSSWFLEKAMIIFLFGADYFRSSQKTVEIKNKFLKSDSSSSGLSIFDFEENINAKDILGAFATANLLAPKRLVIVKNLISKALVGDQKEILDFLKRKKDEMVSEKDLVVIFLEKDSPKKSNALYKFFETLGDKIKKQNFENLSGEKLNAWIVRRIKDVDEKSGISKGALEKLILFTGGNMFSLNQEIQKLVNFSDGEIIGEKDVEGIVKSETDVNIFNTIDALANNNKKEAITLLHNHLEKGEDPFYIFSMFIYQFRNLLKVADLKENFGANEYEISRITKMHPFVIRKSFSQTKNFPLEKLKNIYQKLAELDTQIKTGKMDIKLALDKFVAEL